MAIAATAIPLSHADATTRVEYLKRVAGMTTFGLMLAGVTGFLSAGAIALTPALQGQGAQLVVIFGSYGIAHYAARPLVFSESRSSQWMGFLLGATFQGIAMGYLLLAAILMSAATMGNPLMLVGQALGLTALTAFGLTSYVWSAPRELSLVKGLLSALFLPMLILMVVSFVFPAWFGGPIGLALSAVFVVISALGLLYQVNTVLHELRSDMHVPGAYLVTMGVLILFWNLLVLLMRLQRR